MSSLKVFGLVGKKSIVSAVSTKSVNFYSSKTRFGKLAFSSSSHAPAHGHGDKKDVAHGHGHHETPKPQLTKISSDKHEHLFPHEEGDYIPPTETHSVGDERDELDYGPFETTVLKGGFGTEKSPIVVPSRYASRIVGCTGSAEEEHELLWHEVKENKNLICMDCGQFFALKRYPGFEHFGGHHDHHEEHDFHGHVEGDGFRYMYPPKTAKQLEQEAAERAEELKKDPKSTPKKVKAEGVDYHHTEEGKEGDRLSSKAPIFHDRRPQTYKDRK